MNLNPSVLIVDADPSVQSLFRALFNQMSYSVHLTVAHHAKQAEEFLNNKIFHVVIADEKIMNAFSWHSKVHSAPVLLIGEEKKNASNYMMKPFSLENMKTRIEMMLRGQKNVPIIGESIKQILKQIEQVAPFNTAVLLTGESGTGKELAAQLIHQKSSRGHKAFVAVHCGAVPENLMESEFFGYKKGAFTGAVSDKKGFFESAHEGTLFLDELGELPFHLQAKLLRALQEKTIRPVGSLEDCPVDVRIISATNKNLEKMIQQNLFREDLFHRLNVINIRLPSLRERKKDILLLAQYFLEKHKVKYVRKNLKFSSQALESLKQYPYPGNVRELENLIEKAVLLSTGDCILNRDLFFNSPKEDNILNFELPPEGMDLDQMIRQAEKKILSQAIHRVQGNRAQAAQLLKITPRSLKHRIHKYKLA